MDDVARIAAEIVGKYQAHAALLIKEIAAALREVEKERDGAHADVKALAASLQLVGAERDALTARLARVEHERNEAWAKLGYLTTALPPDATTEGNDE